MQIKGSLQASWFPLLAHNGHDLISIDAKGSSGEHNHRDQKLALGKDRLKGNYNMSNYENGEFVKPGDFGVTDLQYRVAETNFNINMSLAKAGVNQFAHQEDISMVKTQQVIRENQDILYSSAVVDVRNGVTLHVPEYDAYSIIQVIDMQNYSIKTVYAGESYSFTLDDLSYGNYVYLNARTQPTSFDAAGLEAAHKQQASLVIDAKSSVAYEPPEDLISDDLMVEIRTALIADVAAGKVDDYSKLMGTSDFVDNQGHLYATAFGWGGLPAMDAGYIALPINAKGGVGSAVTIDAPPLNYDKGGFWSITTYNKEGWLAHDRAAISNRQAEQNADGSYTVRFNCAGMANNLETENDFAAVLRLYVPTTLEEITAYLGQGQKNYSVEPLA
ncbi:MAG: DUF1254 domain-containing protein [Anderseniella sp.]